MFGISKRRSPAQVRPPVRLELECLEGRELLSVGVIPKGTGAKEPELFVLGLDHQVYAQTFDSTGGSTSGYALVAPGQVKSFALGRLQLVSNLGAVQSDQPRLFAIGLDDQVYAQTFDQSGNSTSPYTLTAPGRVRTLDAGTIAIANTGVLSPELFVLGLDFQVYTQSFDSNGHSTSSGYGLAAFGQVKSFQVADQDVDLNERPQLFVVGLDDQVYAQAHDQVGSPTLFYQLQATGQVKALSVGAGQIFVVGLDDQVYSQTFDLSGDPTSGLFLTQPGRVKAATASQGLPVFLFVVGLDGQVYEQKFNPNGQSNGPYFLTQPGLVL
jgi:hypothetical protein